MLGNPKWTAPSYKKKFNGTNTKKLLIAKVYRNLIVLELSQSLRIQLEAAADGMFFWINIRYAAYGQKPVAKYKPTCEENQSND